MGAVTIINEKYAQKYINYNIERARVHVRTRAIILPSGTRGRNVLQRYPTGRRNLLFLRADL